MNYNKITSDILSAITTIAGADAVISAQAEMAHYSHDETEDLVYYPEVVVKPASVQQISALMQLCNAYNIPITPRGAGTGLAGGALPVNGGLLLSMERFNKIIDIDEQNLQATVEPGVI